MTLLGSGRGLLHDLDGGARNGPPRLPIDDLPFDASPRQRHLEIPRGAALDAHTDAHCRWRPEP